MNTISSASTAHFSNVWVNLATFDRREEADGLNQCLRGEELIRKCRMSENFKSGGFWFGHEQGFMYECRNHRLVLRRTTRMLNRPPWVRKRPFPSLPPQLRAVYLRIPRDVCGIASDGDSDVDANDIPVIFDPEKMKCRDLIHAKQMEADRGAW